MAPNRGAKTPAQTDDSDDDDKKPNYDSNERNLKLYLQRLKRWLPQQHPQLKNFIRYGFILNSRQQVCVFSTSHKDALQMGAITAGTFEKPCTIGISEEEEGSSEYRSSPFLRARIGRAR